MKKMFSLLLAFLLLLPIVGCVDWISIAGSLENGGGQGKNVVDDDPYVISVFENETALIDAINGNSNLPIPYMQDPDAVSDTLRQMRDSGEYEYIDNFMSDDYYGDGVTLSFYGYPDDHCGYQLGYIDLSKDGYSILGISVGDEENAAIETLESFGFTKSDKSPNRSFFGDCYWNGRISISLRTDESGTITELAIEAKSKYIGDRIY